MVLSLRSTVALCGVSLLSSAPSVLAQSSTWVLPTSGNWSVPANWSNGVPGLGGPTAAVIPDYGPLMTVDLDVSPTLTSLFLGTGSSLAQLNNMDVTVGNVELQGSWFLLSTGANTDIRLSGDSLFSGSGTIYLNNFSNNRILGVGGTRQLTLSDGAIVGSGQLGVNSLVLVNQSVISAADVTGLVVDLAPGTVSVNHGILSAGYGSTLTILGSEINNDGGIIRAYPQGTVLFRSSVIHGGSIEVQSGGSAEGTFEATTFDGITLTGKFTQPNNADCVLMGTIVNNGIWASDGTSAGTEMRVGSDVVTLDGTGTFLWSNSVQNKIITSVVGRTLVNGPLHTISGGGQIGANGLVLQNYGRIESTQAAGLTIDGTATPASVNAGTMIAKNGGELLIVGTPLDNSGGVIRAENEGLITLQSSTITGGSIETTGSGEINTSVYPPTLVDVAINGTMRQFDGADVYLSGTIVHDGYWQLEGGTTMCEIQLASDVVTLDGGGQLILAGDNLNNRIHSASGTRTLVNGFDHKILGGGDLCWGDTVLQNNGAIIATDYLVIDTPDTPPPHNLGGMSIPAGGTLELLRSNLVNDGIIYVGSLGTFIVKGSTVAGGMIQGSTGTEDAGKMIVEDINTFSRLDSITFAGEGLIQNGVELRVRSHLTNNGNVLVDSTGTDTNIALEPQADGTVTFDGTGTFEMSDNASNRISSTAGVMTLINGVGHTIAGSGSIGNNLIAINNQGTIASTHATPLHVKTPGATIGFANHGHVVAGGTGEFRVEGGAFTNDGTIESVPNASLVRIGSLLQTGGMTRVDGGLAVTGTYTQTAGLLSGDGILNGNAWIEGGSTSPSAADGGPIGSLSVYGSYGQTLDGGLVADLGVGGNDVLAVSGTVTLGGALQIRLVDPFIPMPGQEFTILTAASITGTFGCIEYPAGGAYFHVVYQPQKVKLVVDSIPVVEADLDFDGVVGPTDLAILLGAWGDEPCGNAICCPADLNGDGKVTALDLATLLGSWG